MDKLLDSDDEYTVKSSDVEGKKATHSKEYMRKYMKGYLDKKNKDNICEMCGGKYKTFNKIVHIKTEKHLKGVKEYEQKQKEEQEKKQKFTEEMYNSLLDEIKQLKTLITQKHK